MVRRPINSVDYFCYVSDHYRSYYSEQSTEFRRTNYSYAGFEVFTAMTLKNAVFWDAAQCGSSKIMLSICLHWNDKAVVRCEHAEVKYTCTDLC
jgi:hypothetical protein